MVKRKNRLEKGIKSLEKQIVLHKNKRQKALEEGNLERVAYYSKEIIGQEKTRDKKKGYLKRKRL